jgi:hypothetical protein
MAFVELLVGRLESKSRWDSVCIFSAGILQNVSLCLGVRLLSLLLPVVLFPLYGPVDGAAVTCTSSVRSAPPLMPSCRCRSLFAAVFATALRLSASADNGFEWEDGEGARRLGLPA